MKNQRSKTFIGSSLNSETFRSINLQEDTIIQNEINIKCRMNQDYFTSTKEAMYKCPCNKIVCIYCIDICHRSHRSSRKFEQYKYDLLSLVDNPCQCALDNHLLTSDSHNLLLSLVKEESSNIIKEQGRYCNNNLLFSLSHPKYYYKRKEDDSFYCLYCINNFTKKTNDSFRVTINATPALDSSSIIEKYESMQAFYAKYAKIPYDYSNRNKDDDVPYCICDNNQHKHESILENVTNCISFINSSERIHYINIVKLTYQLFHDDSFIQRHFVDFCIVKQLITQAFNDSKSDSLLSRKEINFDDIKEWNGFFKGFWFYSTLLGNISSIMHCYECLSDEMQKTFSYQMVSYVLSIHNRQGNWFKTQINFIRMYRKFNISNQSGSQSFSLKENISPLHRLLFSLKNDNIINQNQSNISFIKSHLVLIDQLITICKDCCDNKGLSSKDYCSMLIESLKLIDNLLPYCYNEIDILKTLFDKMKSIVKNATDRKEDITQLIYVIEHISITILTYINDYEFYSDILSKSKSKRTFLSKENNSKSSQKNHMWCFQDNEFNKDILTTLFSLEININIHNHYIQNSMFYDNLINANDYYIEPMIYAISSPIIVKWLNNKENDLNILNIIKGNIQNLYKDNLKIASKLTAIQCLFDSIEKDMFSMFNHVLTEEDFIDHVQAFLVELNNLFIKQIINEKNSNRFIIQLLFIKEQYLTRLFNYMNITQSIQTYLYNIEEDNFVYQNKIKKISQSLQCKLKTVLLYISKQNPIIASLFLSKDYIDIILQKQACNLDFYHTLLKKVFKKSKYYANYNDLIQYIGDTFIHQVFKSISSNQSLLELSLIVFKYALIVSTKKSVMIINNKIATILGAILIHNEFKSMMTINLQNNNKQRKIVVCLFNCINNLKSEYISLLIPKIDIGNINSLLNNLELQPDLKRCLCKTYMKYFTFANIQRDDDQLSNSVKNQEIKNQREYTLKPIIENLKNYQVYYVKHQSYFDNNFKGMLGFFEDTVFEPCLNSLYTFSYFSQQVNADLKYTLYSIIYLFLQCLQMTLNNFTKFDIKNPYNIKAIRKYYIDEKKINSMKETVFNALTLLNGKDCQLLNTTLLFNLYIESIKHFIYYQKYCIENSDLLITNTQNQLGNMSNVIVLSSIVKLSSKYLNDKADYEKDNVLMKIFTDEEEKSLLHMQTMITLDLLYKLYYMKRDQVINKHVFAFDLMRKGAYQLIKYESIKTVSAIKPIYSSILKSKSSLKNKSIDKGKKKNCKMSDTHFGEFYKPYINSYLEEKTSIIESIDHLFKSNPGLWQKLIVDHHEITKHIINIFIETQLPFLTKMVFIDFNRLDTTITPYYDCLLYILEFLRLLCEDHNPIFQTLLINYEKSINFHSEDSKFMNLLFRLPGLILKNLKFAKSKFQLLDSFKVINWDYFTPLTLKITDFIIEIIQGTYIENFDDLTTAICSRSATNGFNEFINIHYQFLDILDGNKEYVYPTAQFFRFLNCFIEESANPLTVKMKVISILNPKKLILVAFNAFKKLCLKYMKNDKGIKANCHQGLLDRFIISDEEFIEDPLFIISTAIFVYLKRVNSYKVKGIGDQFNQILASLKLISEDMTLSEDNTSKLVKKEYYKFCDILIKENEISFNEDKYKESKELNRYQYFFCEEYKTVILDKRNEKAKLKSTYDTVFFMIHPDSLFFSTRDTASFISKSTYTTFNDKLKSILSYYPELSNRMEMRKMLNGHKFLLDLFKMKYDRFEIINAFICLILNLLLLFNVNSNIILPVALIHLLCLFFIIVTWYTFNIIKYIKFQAKSPTIISTLNFIGQSMLDMEIFGFIWTFIWGILACSSISLQFLFSLQLFTFFNIVPTMGSVIYAVQVRYKQFLSTFFLLIILLLFYSSVTFYYFRFNEDGSVVCGSYLECFLHLFNNGIRGGGMSFNIKTNGMIGYWSEFAYSWVFYFIIILIMLNIVNAIIVDTFQALREQNNEIDEEKLNVCFICSLQRSQFEMKGIDFDHHITFEHNPLNYFSYMTKILRTDEHDLNSIDFQVFNCIKNQKIEFFPIGKAKSIDQIE